MNANKKTHSCVLAVETSWYGVCACCFSVFSASSAVNNYDSCIYLSYMLDFLCVSVSILVVNRKAGCREVVKG